MNQNLYKKKKKNHGHKVSFVSFNVQKKPGLINDIVIRLINQP